VNGPRYVPIAPSRLGLMKKLQLASYLHDFLVEHQTDANGHVNYGHAFGYDWIRAHWPGNPDERPCLRVLKKYMACLKRCGLAEVKVVGEIHEMRVRLIDSVKWPQQLPAPAIQLSLYSPLPIPIRKGVEKPVENQRETENRKKARGMSMPSASEARGTIVPRKEVKKRAKETITSVGRAHAMPAVEKTREELDARRRLLLDQADALKRKYKTAG